jgi:hypothetical protein
MQPGTSVPGSYAHSIHAPIRRNHQDSRQAPRLADLREPFKGSSQSSPGIDVFILIGHQNGQSRVVEYQAKLLESWNEFFGIGGR